MGDGIDLASARTPPGMRIYAIGDPHGRLDLLEAMHHRIAQEIARERPTDWRVIHLGDYIDRGPDSRGVLDMLVALRQRDPRFLFLAGNHDHGLLQFLADPAPQGLFVNHGGEDTARSYGVEPEFDSYEGVARTGARLLAALPPAHLEFLHGLEFSRAFGDYFFCHAGIRPGVPLDQQTPEDLIWIRTLFHKHHDLFEKVVVHGHTPADDPELLPNRVNVDTRAYASGRLTAFVAEDAEKKTISVWK